MFNLGLYSYGVVLSLGLMAGLYYFWKMGKDEHWVEISLFDTFFLSLLGYWIAGRVGYAILHPQEIETFWSAFAVISRPGIEEIAGLGGGVAIFFLVAWVKGWSLWKAADLGAVALSLILIFGILAGLIQNLSSWWLAAVRLGWALVTFGVVARVKKEFRFYQWYKGYLSVARDGLAALTFLFSLGLYVIGAAIVSWPNWIAAVQGGVIASVAICGIIYRSARRK